MSNVLKEGAAVTLEGGTKVRLSLRSEGDRQITETEARDLAMLLFRTFTHPMGNWTLVDREVEGTHDL